MTRAFFRQQLQLSLIWITIAMVPIGRVYLNMVPSDAWFYYVILILGLLLIPFLIGWIKFLQKKKLGWIIIIFIQLFLSIIVGLIFGYNANESTNKMVKRTSPAEFKQMNTGMKGRFLLFSGNSYTIFSSLMMLSGLALLIEYNEQLRRKKNQENELKINLAQTQVKMLQSELQPHFIFNTLHSASSLMEFDTNKAQQLLEQFSTLLRNYLDIINRQFYSLEEEMIFLQDYIKVQTLRHNGNISLNIDIPNECLQLQVPVIFLQPIIENSIKHGWIDRSQQLLISIHVEQMEGSLQFTVHDNGTEATASGRVGIGIRNLKERLGVIYDNKYLFSEKRTGGYQTLIIIPIQ